MNRRVSVRGIVMHNGKLLCVKLKPYHGAIKGDFWCTPGGGLDHGEALVAGLYREMIEETGVAPEIGELLYIQQFMYENTDMLEFFFHVKNSRDYLRLDLAKASHGAAEIERIEFVDPKKTDILPSFLTVEPIMDKIADGSPAQVFSQFGKKLA
jgi:ADP-ribose pyrophosphatase YjhB (NUDIX family)